MPRWACWMTSAMVGLQRLANSTALRLDHKPSTGLRSGRRRAAARPPARTAGAQPGPHGVAAMGRQPVPEQGRLLPTQEPAQLTNDLDEGVGVVVAGGDMEGQLRPAAPDAVAEGGRHRGLRPVERMGQGGRATTRRPGPTHVRGQAERGLVEEDQAGSAPLGLCRIRGQRSLTQRSIAAWSRSAARRLGRWTLQPRRWCSTAHTQAGW
jgi:hypothetical protein